MTCADGTIVEVFEWVSTDAIAAAHSNPAVLAMWGRYTAACDIVPLHQLAEAQQLFAGFAPLDL